MTWGKDVFESYYRLESLEYYATVLMYTGNIIGKANELSSEQISKLIQIRQNLGIHTGGTPKGKVFELNVIESSQREDEIREIVERVTKNVLQTYKSKQ